MTMASFDTPNEAVFVARFRKGNKPLFESQIDLATAIIELPHSDYPNKNAVTVRSAVSQIFTGERNLSKNLRSALFTVIGKRFDKKKYNFPKFEKLLIEKFRANYEYRFETKRSGLGDIDYKSLIDATKTAKELLITTLEPAELHKSELADRLKDELLQKTNIVPSDAPSLIQGTYHFYFPDTQDGRIAKEFWLKLRSYAMEQYDLKLPEINKKFEQANSGKEPKILTYLVSPKLALYPFIFLEYKTIKIRGFCVSYIDQDPSVAELSFDVVHTWKEHIFPTLLSEAKQFQFRELL